MRSTKCPIHEMSIHELGHTKCPFHEVGARSGQHEVDFHEVGRTQLIQVYFARRIVNYNLIRRKTI